MAQVASQATEDIATARHEAAQARAAFEQEAAQVGAKQGEMGAAVLAQLEADIQRAHEVLDAAEREWPPPSSADAMQAPFDWDREAEQKSAGGARAERAGIGPSESTTETAADADDGGTADEEAGSGAKVAAEGGGAAPEPAEAAANPFMKRVK